MASPYTYDPKQVALSVNGISIGGYADGTFIMVERSNDAFSKVSGADGIISRAKSNDLSGTITITLAQTSPSNDILSALAKLDEMTNSGIFAVAVADFSGSTVCGAAFAWIRKSSNAEFSKEIGNREWVIDCADLDMIVAGNTGVS